MKAKQSSGQLRKKSECYVMVVYNERLQKNVAIQNTY